MGRKSDTTKSGGIFCTGCRYDLSGLAAGKCPECGQDFDPNIAGSYRSNPGFVPPKWIHKAEWLTSLVPLVPLVLVHVEYVVGRIVLGHWPRSSIDDPKYIPIAKTLHYVSGVSFPLAFASVVPLIALVALAIYARRSWVALRVFCVYAASMSFYTFYARLDPLDIFNWWFD